MSEDVKAKDKRVDDTFSITMELERPLLFNEEDDDNLVKAKKNSLLKKFLIGTLGLLIIGIIGFFLWASDSYKPQNIAKEALISDDIVEVEISEHISFTPKNIEPTKGFIFYPGAKVEPESYAPFARDIAKSGYEVIIADMPLNLAVFSPNIAKKIIAKYENIESWTVGGHSLGGVMAAKFAGENNYVDGVVMLASYPMNDKLKNLGKEVLTIWGSTDGIVNFESLSLSRDKLPEDTTYVEIEGANHSQFGDYGKQNGDNDAIISQEEQLKITSQSIIEFLNKIN